MTHYVCTGDCGSEASRAGACTAEGCSKEGEPLVECNCDDGLHQDVAGHREEDVDMDLPDDQ